MDEGLKFGVSDHLWITYKWFSVSHGADQYGPLAGVPYDGADPKNYSLYVDSERSRTPSWIGTKAAFPSGGRSIGMRACAT